MIKRKFIVVGIILILFFFPSCINKITKNNSLKDSQENFEIKTESDEAIKKLDYEAVYKSLVNEFEPEISTVEEFNNFKKKSNYIKVIEAYDSENSLDYFGGKENEENIRYYSLPTEINKQEYSNNSILFGDINDDGKRDCIISVFRSDEYDEVTFFYVFINYDTIFKLVDVTNETEICGCKKEGWPHRFRYQIIEDGFLKGVSECHYKDAHCCPSIYLKTKVKFINGKLQFYSSEFVMDNALEYRPTPNLDSIQLKNNLKLFD